MRGLLLYTAQDYNRNIWFIGEITKIARELGLEIITQKDGDNIFNTDARFVINRTRNYKISDAFSKRGIRCFNNVLTTEIGNDKWKTYNFCIEHNIPVMPTKRFSQYENIEYPVIAKSIDGHGGKEVFYLESQDEIKDFSSRHIDAESRFILQNPADTLGRDLRVYAIGNRIIKAVLRISDTDFRSNFSLGGSFREFQPNEDIVSTVKKVTENLKSDYIGIDFIPHKDGWVLNEIEDMVGARMLYTLNPDTDILRLFVKRIKSQL